MSAWGAWAAEAEKSTARWAYLYGLSYKRAETFLELLGEKAQQVSDQGALIRMLSQQLAAERTKNAELSEELETAQTQLEELEAREWSS